MAYDYSSKTLDRWEFAAAAETYRLKFEHERRRVTYWQARALSAEAQIAAANTTKEAAQ